MKLKQVTVEVRPSIGFQTVGYSATFDVVDDVDLVQAIDELAEAKDQLQERAVTDILALIEKRQEVEGSQPRPAPQSSSPNVGPFTPVAAPSGGFNWLVANKPNNAGTFQYLSTDDLSVEDFKRQAQAQLAGLGIPEDQVDVWDDRSGPYGLDKGNASYSAGKVKAKKDTPLFAVMQGKAIIASVDFKGDGSIKVSLSKAAQAGVQALNIATQLKGA